MKTGLAERECIPCRGDEEPLKGEALNALHEQLGEGWSVQDDHHLEKTFAFENFRQGLGFVNQVGEIAEEQGHHPDVYLTYNEVTLKIWTHAIDGLTQSDFIFAAKADVVH